MFCTDSKVPEVRVFHAKGRVGPPATVACQDTEVPDAAACENPVIEVKSGIVTVVEPPWKFALEVTLMSAKVVVPVCQPMYASNAVVVAPEKAG